MSQWRLVANSTTMIASNSTATATTSGPPLWVGMITRQGNSAANMVANSKALVQNTTPGSVLIHGYSQNSTNQSAKVVGVFPFTPAAYANGLANNSAAGAGEFKKAAVAGTGWVLRTNFEGPVTAVTANGGSNIANGETVTLSGGTANATITLTSNLYTNLTNLSVTGAATGLGNANTGVLTVANVNGIAVANATFISNSTGGLINTGITIVSGGLFANGQTNAGLIVSAVWSNGAVANVTGLTFVANASANIIAINPGASVITTPGLFPNASVSSNTFVRQLHLTNLSVTGTDTGLGNANTGYSLVTNSAAITVANVAWTSNATGGLANSGITIPPTTVGLFPANQTNVGLVVTSFWSNGAVANVTGATFVANVSPSTGGSISIKTTGGRSGRVTYENLVATRFIANGALANSTSSASQFPQ